MTIQGAWTDDTEKKLLDHTLGNTVMAVPAVLEAAASTTVVNDDGTGLTEPVGNGYARLDVSALFSVTGRTATNSADWNFATPTGPWGTITHMAIVEQGGPILIRLDLSTPLAVDVGTPLSIVAGNINIVQRANQGPSDYLAEQWLRHVLKIGAFAQPAQVFRGSSSTDPTDDFSGITEPVGVGYARIATNWNAAGAGPGSVSEASNNGEIRFPTATAAWVDQNFVTLHDALTSGNGLYRSPYDQAPVSVALGQDLVFPDGDSKIQLD